jgi:hypothetical protein
MSRMPVLIIALFALVLCSLSTRSVKASDTVSHLTVYDAGIGEFLEERTVELQSGINTIEWRSLMPKAYLTTIRVTAENADVIRQYVTHDGVEIRNEKSPVLHIVIQNKGATGLRRVQIDYLAPDLDWRNDYSLVLDPTSGGAPPTSAILDSWVTINNKTGTDIAAGTIDLVAGEIALLLSGDGSYPRREREVAQNISGAFSSAAPGEPMAEVSGLSAFSRFRLGNNITMNANSPVNRFPLFQKTRIDVVQRNVFENEHNTQTVARGGFILLPRGLEVRLVARNTTGMAMPSGQATIYARSDNLAQLVGQDGIALIPVNGEFGLTQGKSSTLFGTRRVLERRQVEYSTPQSRTREKLMTRVEVVITNRGALAVEAYVRDGVEPYGENQWTVVESSSTAEKLGANSVQFKVQVPAGGKTTVTYTLETK